MNRWIWGVALALVPAVTAADVDRAAPAAHICTAKPPAPTDGPASSLLSGYGTGGIKVRTASPQAQAYFDNGMQLAHAFAHKASVAAFRAAEAADPSCAMCAWGEAWARGPTINYPIDAKTQAELAALADRAALLAKDGPQEERQLIAALQLRYHDGGGKGPGDYAFARAMDKLARERPSDNEIAILAADGWMIPAAQKDSRENVDRSIALLEAALARNPNDTGAIHFYIHATEIWGVAAKALPYAERLQALAPAASHLVHMPSHTYYRVGRYEAALRSNLDAVRIDEANAERLRAQGGVWGLSYHAHNVHFGIGAALMDGDGAAALSLADPVIAGLPTSAPGSQTRFVAAPAFYAEGRYGDPARILALPEPPNADAPLKAAWLFARGEALARRGDAAGVRAEADKIRALPAARGSGQAVVEIARLVLAGRAAMLEGKPLVAADAYRQAAALQEAKLVTLNDPPAWWYPARRSAAAALLAAGRPAEAAAEARKVLAAWPDDPLTLVILSRAETALGRKTEASAPLEDARKGWKGDPTSVAPALI